MIILLMDSNPEVAIYRVIGVMKILCFVCNVQKYDEKEHKQWFEAADAGKK